MEDYEDINEILNIDVDQAVYQMVIRDYLILSIAGVIVAALVIFLVLYFNKRKNNKNDNLVYEDQMDEQELKKLDDEIN